MNRFLTNYCDSQHADTVAQGTSSESFHIPCATAPQIVANRYERFYGLYRETMKVLYLLILLNSVSLFAQQDSSDWGRDILLEQYKWDVEKKERGTMMFLDLRFEYKNKDEFLTLTIAKNYKKDVPEFISVILPDRVDTVNGLYFGFVSTVKDTSKVGWTLKPDTAASILCRYDKHRDDYYTTRFVDGIATTKDGREKNCFQSFMTHNHVVIMFWLGPEREKKSIMLPLLSFKQQYGELE